MPKIKLREREREREWINRVSKYPKIPVPESVKQSSQEYGNDCNVVLGFINQHYEITGLPGDTVKSSDLFRQFKLDNYGTKTDTRKFKQELEKISGITAKHTKEGNVFTGLKEKEPEEDS